MDTATRQLRLAQPFNLDETLALNTQDFRWKRWQDGGGVNWHSGVLQGRLIHIRQINDALEYRASEDADLTDLLYSYFCLGEDIKAVHSALSSADETMRKLVSQYPEMRVLRQPDPWECTVAFICSALKGPKAIAEIVNKVAKELGENIELDNEQRRTFPAPRDVLANGEKLKKMELGLQRDRKIVAASERVLEEGPLERLVDVSYGEARWELDRFDGIGGKIADCIALFSLGKREAFPVDRRVRRALKRHYKDTKNVSDDTLALWGTDTFGEHAGYASQLLYLDGAGST